MSVGILVAMPEERAAFGNDLKLERPIRRAGLRFERGTLDDQDVVLVECGIGKVAASLAATLLLERFECESLMFSGVAGSLDRGVPVGSLVLANSVLQHDYGACRDGVVQAFQPGALPTVAPDRPAHIDVEPDLLAAATRALQGIAGLRIGRILTGDAYLACSATRDRLAGTHEALAIDMESGAVAQIARAYDVPWLVVRSVSDLAGEDSHLDFHAFVKQVAPIAADAVRRLVPLLAAAE